jgi:uroporphyrinogen decarboxylase
MRDRFLRACRLEPVDATPVWFMRQAGRALPEYRAIRERASLVEITRDPALVAEVTLLPVRTLGVDAAIMFADITTPLAGIGVDVELVDGIGPVIASPIRGPADLARLRSLDVEASIGPLIEAIGLVRNASPVPVIGFAGAPFTMASYLVEGSAARDGTRLKAMLRDSPATFDRLMGLLVEMTKTYLRAQVRAGAQAIQLFDSWVGVLSPYDYERSVAPHMTRLFDELEDLDVPTIHFGTGTAGLLRSMAAAGGDVIGLDWRIALADGWAAVPGRAVQGNLDPALLLGSFDAARRQAGWILAQASGRPGHIFNLGHGLLPETKVDPIRRLVDLVHEATERTATDLTAAAW